jgi:hypothetical protein
VADLSTACAREVNYKHVYCVRCQATVPFSIRSMAGRRERQDSYFAAGAAAAGCAVPLAGALLSWSVLVAEGCACCSCCRCSCCCCSCSCSACCSSSFHSRVSGRRMSPYSAASSAAHPVAMKGALHPAWLQSLRSCSEYVAVGVQSAEGALRRLGRPLQIVLCHCSSILLKSLTSGRTCLQAHRRVLVP